MRKITIEEKWHQQSEAAKSAAQKLPQGKERDALIKKARQLETASQINQWLSSPELSCLVPAFDGALFSIEWKEALVLPFLKT
jgi:hypothetical protein